MVIKLIKHELHCMLRVAAVPMTAMIAFAILCRIGLSTWPTSADGILILLFMFYFFALIATLGVCYLFGISRFFKSLFTGEGYMTLSLPVNADQLIAAKLISSIITMFCGIIVCALSCGIFFIGLPAEVYAQIRYWITEIYTMYNLSFGAVFANDPFLVVEIVIETILNIPVWFLVFYCVMSIAQLFTVKNRKATALFLYIGIMFVWGLLQQIVFDPILDSAAEVSLHLYMWIKIIFVAAVNVGCYFTVRYILMNKVNLL